MTLWLTSAELEDLTGYKRKGEQVHWLQANNVDHTVRADGVPRVPRYAFTAPPPKADGSRPNFAALGKAS